MKKVSFTIIKVLISFCFIGFLLWTMRGKLTQVVEIIGGMGLFSLAGGFVCYFLGFIIIALRLMLLLNAQGLAISYNETLSLTFIGLFFNNFLPTSMGGDVAKAYYASQRSSNKAGCVATILMDRLAGLFSLFLLAGVAIFFGRAYKIDGSIPWIVAFVLILVVLFFIILWNKKLAQKFFVPLFLLFKKFKFTHGLRLDERLRRAYETVNSFKDKKGLMISVLLISLSAQAICFLSAYFWLKGLGNPVPVQIVLLIMPLVSVLSMLPSINGLGIREYSIVFLLGPYAGGENAFAVSLLTLFTLLTGSVIGGLSYAFGNQYKINKAMR